MSRLCLCTSKRPFDKCCEPYLTGKKLPETAEKLMRSRFSAYALCKADYLIATTAEKERAELEREELTAYCRTVKCISLKIISTEAGGPEDSEGIVLFHASLQVDGKRMLHREKSRFVREEGRWVYVDGETN
ncbi:YchJ family protein [Holophaga foetida]|uniref:YchJ family protein n=1 Tax=Holophaga foetida TaxID=35839 RepID=UPI0002473AB9|nr:YchJ family metal-binding protein [Holophaga foetida]